MSRRTFAPTTTFLTHSSSNGRSPRHLPLLEMWVGGSVPTPSHQLAFRVVWVLHPPSPIRHHLDLALTPTRRSTRPTPADPNNLNSDNTQPAIPSSVPNLSARAAPSDEPDEIRAIWGTTVKLTETMKPFRNFVKGFKPKYRASYDRENGLKTRPFSTSYEGEVILYESYFRRCVRPERRTSIWTPSTC